MSGDCSNKGIKHLLLKLQQVVSRALLQTHQDSFYCPGGTLYIANGDYSGNTMPYRQCLIWGGGGGGGVSVGKTSLPPKPLNFDPQKTCQRNVPKFINWAMFPHYPSLPDEILDETHDSSKHYVHAELLAWHGLLLLTHPAITQLVNELRLSLRIMKLLITVTYYRINQ